MKKNILIFLLFVVIMYIISDLINQLSEKEIGIYDVNFCFTKCSNHQSIKIKHVANKLRNIMDKLGDLLSKSLSISQDGIVTAIHYHYSTVK